MLKQLSQETQKPVGYPITESNFRALYAALQPPQVLSPEYVERLGWCLFDVSAPPELGRYQKAEVGEDVRDDRGIWMQQWNVVEQTEVEKAETDAKKGDEVRSRRQGELFMSDWTQLLDTPLSAEKKAEWATYRQALRDITNQTGFPWDVTWPTKPTS